MDLPKYLEPYTEADGIITGTETGRQFVRTLPPDHAPQSHGNGYLMACIGACGQPWLTASVYADGLACPACGDAICPVARVYRIRA